MSNSYAVSKYLTTMFTDISLQRCEDPVSKTYGNVNIFSLVLVKISRENVRIEFVPLRDD